MNYPIWLGELEDGTFSSALQDSNHYLHPYLPHNFEDYTQKIQPYVKQDCQDSPLKITFPDK